MTSEYYMFNKNSSIFKNEQGYIFNSDTNSLIKLTNEKHDSINYLLNAEKFTYDDLYRYFDEVHIKKMIKYKNVIPYSKKNEDSSSFLSRQNAFFSLVSSDVKTYNDNINKANILILGAGAIGSHIFWNMLSIGVKKITIVDYDSVELSNLNRQLFYDYNDIGEKKIDVLYKKGSIKSIDADINIIDMKISKEIEIENLIKGHSLVIKAIDTPKDATYWVNKSCVKNSIPYISGGFIDHLGIIGPTYIPKVSSFCMECYTLDNTTQKITNSNGTIAPMTTIVSSKMAMIAMKIIINDHLSNIVDKNYIYNFMDETWTEEKQNILKDKCPVCKKEKKKNVSNYWYFLPLIISIIPLIISFSINIPLFIQSFFLFYLSILIISFHIAEYKYISAFLFIESIAFTFIFLFYSTINNYQIIFPDFNINTIMSNMSSLFIGGLLVQTILFWSSLLMIRLSIYFVQILKNKIFIRQEI